MIYRQKEGRAATMSQGRQLKSNVCIPHLVTSSVVRCEIRRGANGLLDEVLNLPAEVLDGVGACVALLCAVPATNDDGREESVSGCVCVCACVRACA
jgi:hypothetical protein